MKRLGSVVLTLVVSLSLLMVASAQVDPVEVKAALYPGESLEVQTVVTTQTSLPAIDVVISMDLTGSMEDRLGNLKTEVGNIIAALALEAADLNVGVVSHEDYPWFYGSCGYGAQYGESVVGDQPFRVDYAVGGDLLAASAAVDAMSTKGQQDLPESYARVMWESGQTDSGIDYRTDAQKILVMFVDDVPHDCDLYGDGTVATGKDPGRDAVAGTSTDIDLQDDAIPAMQKAGIRLLVVSSGSDTALWDTIAAETGGAAVQINADGTVPDGLSLTELILSPVSKAEAEGQTDVWWRAVCDPELAVTLLPEVYYDVSGGTTLDFAETIGVPTAAEPGDYDCTVTFYADEYPEEGAVIGVQNIRVTVPEVSGPLCLDLDIKPGSLRNSINPKSKGVVPVAILGNEGVDVEKIDVRELQFGPDGATPAHDLLDLDVYRDHIQDVNGDGYMDLVSHYRRKDTVLSSGETEVCLTGKLNDGSSFEACDSVRVPGKW
jgi:hypothetical protein